MAFRERLEGLLGGSSTIGNLGLGLLAASGPSATPQGFGQVLANAAQFASGRQLEAMRNQAAREQLLQMRRQRELGSKVDELVGSLGGTVGPNGQPIPGSTPPINPQQQAVLRLMAQADPTAALTQLGGILFDDKPQQQIGESPVGKLFADLEAAEASGNTAAATALQTAIQNEIGDEVDLSEIRSTRSEVLKNSDTFLEAQRGFERVQVGAAAASAAGDLALIFGFMKTLDPGSTVREGEQANARNAAGVPERIRGMYNRIMTGEQLSADQRQDFLSQARSQFGKDVEQQNRIISDARGFAERHDLAVEDVVPEFVIPRVDFSETGSASGGSINLGGGVTLEFVD